MLKFFKRVTKDDLIDRLFADVGNLYKELASKQVQIVQLYQSCDELHAAVRELRSAKQVQQDSAAEDWRPTADAAGMVKQCSKENVSFERIDLKARKLKAKQVIVDPPDEPKRKPPYMPWAESVVTMEHTIRNKMSLLAGSSENFIRSCRKKDCHVLVSKTTRVMLDQSGKTDKLREYPHGYIEMRHKRKRTSAGNPMRKYYTFETPQGYENAKKALEQMKCPYTTGKNQ